MPLVQPVTTAAGAATMRQALKARYAEAEWFGALQGVQDRLRVAKRDALVAYLLAENPGLRDTNDLYDHFLIDVEMGACMATSRIVQAHATVQLFVQRCLLGLEPDSVAAVTEDPGWDQWNWMANYRVWEANRKIFLYPENWILPELRDDKSELFTELDDQLQQDELTDLAVENATIAYLEKLDDLAHLDVMACYYQHDRHLMHVFARTRGGDPTVYYHRQFERERYWTPWRRVPLDIAGDHLLAFDRNSRLTAGLAGLHAGDRHVADLPDSGPGRHPAGRHGDGAAAPAVAHPAGHRRADAGPLAAEEDLQGRAVLPGQRLPGGPPRGGRVHLLRVRGRSGRPGDQRAHRHRVRRLVRVDRLPRLSGAGAGRRFRQPAAVAGVQGHRAAGRTVHRTGLSGRRTTWRSALR